MGVVHYEVVLLTGVIGEIVFRQCPDLDTRLFKAVLHFFVWQIGVKPDKEVQAGIIFNYGALILKAAFFYAH